MSGGRCGAGGVQRDMRGEEDKVDFAGLGGQEREDGGLVGMEAQGGDGLAAVEDGDLDGKFIRQRVGRRRFCGSRRRCGAGGCFGAGFGVHAHQFGDGRINI